MLPKLAAKACGHTTPRSGEEGEKVNCFLVALDSDVSPFFLTTGYEDQKLVGLKWNGHSYADKHSIALSKLGMYKLKITHYYGLDHVIYNSIYDVVWNYITKYAYLKIHLYRFINSTHQFFFNKHKLVTKKRMELIQFMMNNQLDRTHDGIESSDLMTKLYSINWILHPSGEEQQKKLEFYLESLVLSGELKVINNEYVVTGKAISTIEKYEEEERRHTEAVKLQKRMFWLTILLLIAAIIQSGVIKLPALLDLSNNIAPRSTHSQANAVDAKK
jgi:hypothetical protein